MNIVNTTAQQRVIMIDDSLEGQFNRELYSSYFDEGYSFEFPISNREGAVVKVTATASVIYDSIDIMPKRALCVVDIRIPKLRIEYRQPFYRSSGTATPDICPKGTWVPFDFLWLDEAIDAYYPEKKLPYGWIGKHVWNPFLRKWRYHGKCVTNFGQVATQLSKLLMTFN